MTPTRRTPIGATAAVLVLLAALAGCAADDGTSGTSDDGGAAASYDQAGLPAVPPDAGHVHGMAINPADGLLYLGTHVGTMVVEDGAVSRVGDSTVDLMGFAAAGPDHFYASGHPGEGDDLPNPVGLIESTDAGRTWHSVSLAGEADFHTLGVAETQVYGFYGQLVASRNGTDWTAAASDVAPISIAVDPGTTTRLIATTEHGPMISTDAGATFEHLADAPLLVFVSWPTADRVWGIGVDGAVYRSDDAGSTWERRGTVGTAPAAFTAAQDGTVAATTDNQILTSTDDGQTFAPVASYSPEGH